ncbi:MAG: M66 family metalloprotease [Candidatus Poribacteria bacterium]|nr:M66 family metalloprotease [Candidatus Poribacteria bacterium]
MKKRLTLLLILFFSTQYLFLCVFSSYGDTPFFVQTVYFQPIDAPPLTAVRDTISKLTREAQQLYREQMAEHGFGHKTFRTENDEQGNVIIHTVSGKEKVSHYVQNTWEKVLADLPDTLNPSKPPWDKQDTIRLVIVGGVKFVDGNKWGVGFPRHSNRYGGSCYIAGGSHAFNANLIFHELGHCFGLYHKPEGKPFEIAHYEARWLSKHYHFNKRVNAFTFPQLVNNKPVLTDIGNNFVRFEIDATSDIGLHQAKIFRDNDIVTIAYDYLNGKKNDTVSLEAPKRYWEQNMKLTVMDNNGNYFIKDMQINLSAIGTLDITPRYKLALRWCDIKTEI